METDGEPTLRLLTREGGDIRFCLTALSLLPPRSRPPAELFIMRGILLELLTLLLLERPATATATTMFFFSLLDLFFLVF